KKASCMAVLDIPRVGFLGAGKMATSLASGWLAAGLTSPVRVMASDPAPEARQCFAQKTGAQAIPDNRQVVAASELLVLAVKPQSMKALLAEVRPAVTSGHLVVSIAAGLTFQPFP